MKTLYNSLLTLALVVAGAAAAQADVTVELSDVHLCCRACVTGVAKALAPVDGAQARCDTNAGKVTIMASNRKVAQAAIDALAAAGYHGTSNDAKLAMKDDSGAGKEKVSRLVVSGAHNCCGGCADALESAATGVDGVKGVEIAPRKESFVVEGEFVPAALVAALNAAGFHVKVSAN